MDFQDPVPLGRTGLMVGRLGVASGYWAPPGAIEMAFERGCNYFTWAWGRLLNPKKMPAGEAPPSAADCYRFALSHPAVDVCMMGARTVGDMRENLRALDLGPLDADEMARIRRVGDHCYGKPRAVARPS